jgi:hypothetical protein
MCKLLEIFLYLIEKYFKYAKNFIGFIYYTIKIYYILA